MNDFVFKKMGEREIRDATVKKVLEIFQFPIEAVCAFDVVNDGDRSFVSLCQNRIQFCDRVSHSCHCFSCFLMLATLDLLFHFIDHSIGDLEVGCAKNFLPSEWHDDARQLQNFAIGEDIPFGSVNRGK